MLAAARDAGFVTGTDTSPDMLIKARSAAKAFGIRNAASEERLSDEESYDWANFYIVLWHIPPRRGYAILRPAAYPSVTCGFSGSAGWQRHYP